MGTQDFDRETGGAGAPKTGSLRERIAALSAPRTLTFTPVVEPEPEEVWDDGMEDTTPGAAFPWEDPIEQEAVEEEAGSLAFIRAQTGGDFDPMADDPLGLGGGVGSGFPSAGRSAVPVSEKPRAQEEAAPVSFAKAYQEEQDTWAVPKPVEMKLKREPPARPVYSDKPVRTGPNARAARAVRTDDPSRFPIPLGGRDGRYTAWDLEDDRVKSAVSWLAWPDRDDRTNRQRMLSADFLIEEWQNTWGENPSVADILHAWWRAARRIVDVAAAAGMAGASPNAAFGRLASMNAVEFADRMEVDFLVFEKEMLAIGIPTPPMTDPDTSTGDQ
jgi:hypothetical protein